MKGRQINAVVDDEHIATVVYACWQDCTQAADLLRDALNREQLKAKDLPQVLNDTVYHHYTLVSDRCVTSSMRSRTCRRTACGTPVVLYPIELGSD